MSRFDGLKHVERTTADGATILVLDTGAVISTEDEAMLQAMHSRSTRGIKGHLEALSKRGSGSFMDQYYVGYGDKSIGDCGTTTVFLEGVSMLAAKAIQDWSLYSGQESSTRYIDFATQPFFNPYKSEFGESIQENWRKLYLWALPHAISDLTQRFPIQEGENEKEYEKAIKARAFDMVRGFLPAGAQTNLAWHTNLRQASDHLMRLRHHPLPEVRNIAETILDALKEKHPHSFNQKKYPATESLNEEWMQNNYYYTRESGIFPDFMGSVDRLNPRMIHQHRDLLASRPLKTEVPREFGDSGLIDYDFLLDFASFRDIQRHRAVYQRMPLLEATHGFEQWYLSEFPFNIGSLIENAIDDNLNQINKLITEDGGTTVEDQYYFPMGMRVPCRISGDFPSIVWLIELRATRFVHPTLRMRAIQMAEFLTSELGIPLHLDPEPNRFDVKRGTHDIVMKE